MSLDVGDGIAVLHDSDDDCLSICTASVDAYGDGALVVTTYDHETGECASVRVLPEEWAAIVAAFPPITTPTTTGEAS